MKKEIVTTRDITYIAAFVSLITVCSWITIPLPIPISMQTFAVMLCGALLKKRESLISIFVYILLGIVGVPVFAGFSSGISVIMGPTGGYIIGFIFMVYIIGLILEKSEHSTVVLFLSMFIGTLICYLFGTVWFLFIYAHNSVDLWYVISLCILPFIIPDIIKMFIAVFFVNKLSKFIIKV